MGIMFFEKSKLDLDLGTRITLSVSDGVASEDGADVLDLLRNRQNTNGWGTVGTTDAANTTITVQFGDQVKIDSLFLLRNNFASYRVRYQLNGGGLTEFAPAINETGNTEQDVYHAFTPVTVDEIQLLISGTMTADDEKTLAQLVATRFIGELAQTQPRIRQPVHVKNRQTLETLSGKARVTRNVGGFRLGLEKESITYRHDLSLIEDLHGSYEGFLVWLNGNDSTKFKNVLPQGYRRQDLYLMQIASDYSPEWRDGYYNRGINQEIELVESVY